MCKYVTYYRVSTARQGQFGLGIEAQRAAVNAYLTHHQGRELASFTEVESGKVNTRPQLEAALARCRQTGATLLVAKLDRLSRNVAFLLNLREAGVRFQALDIPDANTMTLSVMAGMAQHERELISARTKAALAARRARGLPLGQRRDMSAYQARGSALGVAQLKAQALARAKIAAQPIADAKAAGCTSLRQIAAWLNSAEVLTPRGGKWTANAVMKATRRLQGN
jgi:DNA invertase Pin-like site-specific DNA recombinase